MNPQSETTSAGRMGGVQEIFREPAAAPQAAPARSVLDDVLEATKPEQSKTSSRLQQFLDESSPWHALILWVGESAIQQGISQQELGRLLNRDIAYIDGLLNRQVNAILHHPRFQKLEASWRGLRYLVDQVEEGEEIKVKVLSATWKEVARDMDRAIEFDQSQLFRKVYSEEFGSPGGEPYGVLLGDYEIRHRPGPDSPTDDIETLTRISHVAAASFSPFITSAHPALLGMDSFTEIEHPLNLSNSFEQLEYTKWRSLRNSEDSRFVGVVLPHTLMRLPYPDDGSRSDGFPFREEVSRPDRSQYLWGNAVYAFGAVVVRAFAESGWLAGIRGVERGVEAGGLVTGLPCHTFGTDSDGVAMKSSTDAVIVDLREKELSELGLIPLCHCQDTEHAAFYSTQSIQRPKQYDELPATINARMSAMLQYMLSVARFAHYLKVIARDKIGSFTTAGECEDFLSAWLQKYCIANDEAALETKAKYPLREGQVQVREFPDKPGSYLCVTHLRPHFQLDEMAASIRLATELNTAAG